MTEISGELRSLAAVAALVFANGFFVAAEFALVSVRRPRIEEGYKDVRGDDGRQLPHLESLGVRTPDRLEVVGDTANVDGR